MTPVRTLPLLVPLVLALAGCTQFAIRSDHDRTADFSRLRTYAWLPLAEVAPADQRVLDRYIDARIRSAVDAELGAKGCRPAGSEPPDFFLNYRLVTESTEQQRTGSRSYLLGARWEGWSGVDPKSAPSCHTRVRKFVAAIRSCIHSRSSFGSNTDHCVPSMIDSAM